MQSPEMLEVLYGDPLQCLKSALRGAITAREGYSLAIWDYAQIEARVLAWLAGEQRLLRGFAQRNDVYRLFACEIYRLPVDMINKAHRFVGKTAVLGLGYSMGGPKFQVSLAGSGIEMPVGECKRIVELYRSTFPRVPALWQEVDRLWRKSAHTGMSTSFAGLLEFDYKKKPWGDCVRVKLPSGRRLHYWNPKAEGGRGSYQSGQFRKEVYGGLLVENICQAIAADIMAFGSRMAEQKWMLPFALIHDQGLALKLVGQTPDEFSQALATLPSWAKGLPLKVETKTAPYYSK
jgi:DNA polymerase